MTTDSLLHVLAVADSAKSFPVPHGSTKQEQVFTAVMHDIGHMVDANADRHGAIGAQIIKQVFPQASPQSIEAIKMHMSRTKFTSPLQQALHAADVDDGVHLDFDTFLSK